VGRNNRDVLRLLDTRFHCLRVCEHARCVNQWSCRLLERRPVHARGGLDKRSVLSLDFKRVGSGNRCTGCGCCYRCSGSVCWHESLLRINVQTNLSDCRESTPMMRLLRPLRHVKSTIPASVHEAQLFAAERTRGACVREIYDATKQGICVF